MKKLALNVDDLDVQSFGTTSALARPRCTVRGHQVESWDELACSGGCPTLVYTCVTCETCVDPCAPPPTHTTDETADPGRRVIVY